MSPVLVTPPASEPVSLAEAKLYLKVDAVDEDDLILSLIRAARLTVEAASRRQLISQTWRLVLNGWPARGLLESPLAPLRAVTAARAFDAAGTPQAAALSAFAIEQGSDPPVIRIDGVMPAPGRPRAGVEIDVTAGFGPAAADVPQNLRQAILLLVARWFERRGDQAETSDASLPADVMALVAPSRRVRL